MPNLPKDIADVICFTATHLDPGSWLAKEVAVLALTIPHLDEIHPQALLPLAKLVEMGPSDAKRLARVLHIDEPTLEVYLDALCEFNFAQLTVNGYEVTQSGGQAFSAVGDRMIVQVRNELKRNLDKYEQLYQSM